jgi:hypothetical protein
MENRSLQKAQNAQDDKDLKPPDAFVTFVPFCGQVEERNHDR